MRKLLTVVLVTALMGACSGGKEPAESAVKGLEKAAADAKPEIERFAADRWAGVNDAVTAVRAKFDSGSYTAAMADVQTAAGTVTSAAQAAAARKAQLATQWAAFAGMPAMIGQIKGKVDELTAMKRLPRGMDKTRVDSAKSSLNTVVTLWDEASSAHDKGDLVVAVSKATDAKPVIDSLMTMFAIPAGVM